MAQRRKRTVGAPRLGTWPAVGRTRLCGSAFEAIAACMNGQRPWIQRQPSVEGIAQGCVCWPEMAMLKLLTGGTLKWREVTRKMRLNMGTMEPVVGIEPTTCCLRNSCSASELHRRLLLTQRAEV